MPSSVKLLCGDKHFQASIAAGNLYTASVLFWASKFLYGVSQVLRPEEPYMENDVIRRKL